MQESNQMYVFLNFPEYFKVINSILIKVVGLFLVGWWC